jgi:hypothetical protein
VSRKSRKRRKVGNAAPDADVSPAKDAEGSVADLPLALDCMKTVLLNYEKSIPSTVEDAKHFFGVHDDEAGPFVPIPGENIDQLGEVGSMGFVNEVRIARFDVMGQWSHVSVCVEFGRCEELKEEVTYSRCVR